MHSIAVRCILIVVFVAVSSQKIMAQQKSDFTPPVSYYDIHVYFDVNDEQSFESAKSLHAELRKKFPQMPIYNLVPQPIGPHPMPMFEAHLMNSLEFGQVISFLCTNRRDHSILVHPHTGNGLLDHSHHHLWMGTPLQLDLSIFNRLH